MSLLDDINNSIANLTTDLKAVSEKLSNLSEKVEGGDDFSQGSDIFRAHLNDVEKKVLEISKEVKLFKHGGGTSKPLTPVQTDLVRYQLKEMDDKFSKALVNVQVAIKSKMDALERSLASLNQDRSSEALQDMPEKMSKLEAIVAEQQKNKSHQQGSLLASAHLKSKVDTLESSLNELTALLKTPDEKSMKAMASLSEKCQRIEAQLEELKSKSARVESISQSDFSIRISGIENKIQQMEQKSSGEIFVENVTFQKGLKDLENRIELSLKKVTERPLTVKSQLAQTPGFAFDDKMKAWKESLLAEWTQTLKGTHQQLDEMQSDFTKVTKQLKVLREGMNSSADNTAAGQAEVETQRQFLQSELQRLESIIKKLSAENQNAENRVGELVREKFKQVEAKIKERIESEEEEAQKLSKWIHSEIERLEKRQQSVLEKDHHSIESLRHALTKESQEALTQINESVNQRHREVVLNQEANANAIREKIKELERSREEWQDHSTQTTTQKLEGFNHQILQIEKESKDLFSRVESVVNGTVDAVVSAAKADWTHQLEKSKSQGMSRVKENEGAIQLLSDQLDHTKDQLAELMEQMSEAEKDLLKRVDERVVRAESSVTEILRRVEQLENYKNQNEESNQSREKTTTGLFEKFGEMTQKTREIRDYFEGVLPDRLITLEKKINHISQELKKKSDEVTSDVEQKFSVLQIRIQEIQNKTVEVSESFERELRDKSDFEGKLSALEQSLLTTQQKERDEFHVKLNAFNQQLTDCVSRIDLGLQDFDEMKGLSREGLETMSKRMEESNAFIETMQKEFKGRVAELEENSLTASQDLGRQYLMIVKRCESLELQTKKTHADVYSKQSQIQDSLFLKLEEAQGLWDQKHTSIDQLLESTRENFSSQLESLRQHFFSVEESLQETERDRKEEASMATEKINEELLVLKTQTTYAVKKIEEEISAKHQSLSKSLQKLMDEQKNIQENYALKWNDKSAEIESLVQEASKKQLLVNEKAEGWARDVSETLKNFKGEIDLKGNRADFSQELSSFKSSLKKDVEIPLDEVQKRQDSFEKQIQSVIQNWNVSAQVLKQQMTEGMGKSLKTLQIDHDQKISHLESQLTSVNEHLENQEKLAEQALSSLQYQFEKSLVDHQTKMSSYQKSLQERLLSSVKSTQEKIEILKGTWDEKSLDQEERWNERIENLERSALVEQKEHFIQKIEMLEASLISVQDGSHHLEDRLSKNIQESMEALNEKLEAHSKEVLENLHRAEQSTEARGESLSKSIAELRTRLELSEEKAVADLKLSEDRFMGECERLRVLSESRQGLVQKQIESLQNRLETELKEYEARHRQEHEELWSRFETRLSGFESKLNGVEQKTEDSFRELDLKLERRFKFLANELGQTVSGHGHRIDDIQKEFTNMHDAFRQELAGIIFKEEGWKHLSEKLDHGLVVFEKQTQDQVATIEKKQWGRINKKSSFFFILSFLAISLISLFSLLIIKQQTESSINENLHERFSDEAIQETLVASAKAEIPTIMENKSSFLMEEFQEAVETRREYIEDVTTKTKEKYDAAYTDFLREVTQFADVNAISRLENQVVNEGSRKAYRELIKLRDSLKREDSEQKGSVEAALLRLETFYRHYLLETTTLEYQGPLGTVYRNTSIPSDVLLSFLRDEDDWHLRAKAAKLLGLWRRYGIPDFLVMAMQDDLSVPVMVEAHKSFAKVTGYKMDQVLDVDSAIQWWDENQDEVNHQLNKEVIQEKVFR